jgi:hypothetical protein
VLTEYPPLFEPTRAMGISASITGVERSLANDVLVILITEEVNYFDNVTLINEQACYTENHGVFGFVSV